MNRVTSRVARRFVGLVMLAVLVLTAAAAHAQTIFSESFDSAWTTPTTLLTGGNAWSGIGTGNNQWQRNDFTTGWSSSSGSYTPTGAQSTTNSARFHSFDASSGTFGSLITPTIDFSSFAGAKRVAFYSINTSGGDSLRVWLSTDGGTNYSLLTVLNQSATWTQYTADLGTTTSSTVKIKFEGRSDFGTTDIGLDQMSIYVVNPLSGTKTIGAGGDYTTFTAAINALNQNGVAAGGVTFNVTAGSTFTEDVPAIASNIGSSAANPVVFQKSGAGANPVIKPTGGTGTTDFGFGITGADYVTVDGIDITENTGSAVEYGFLVKNATATDGATNVTIKNATITLNRANTSSYGIMATSSTTAGGGTTPTSAAGANSNNKFQNIVVINSYNGMAMLGGSGSFPDASNEIGVTGGGTTQFGGAVAGDSLGVGSSTCYGIRLVTQSGVKVSNAIVRNIKITSSINAYGIYLDDSATGTYAQGEISNNTVNGIFSSSTSTSSVLYGIRADVSTGNVVKIFNNDIYGMTPPLLTAATTTQVCRALAANAGSNSGTVNAYYNSVHIGSGLTFGSLLGTSAAFYMAGGTVNLANNIFSNVTPAQTTAKHYAAYVSAGTVASSSNNILWAPNTNGVIGSQGATDRTTLQIFAAAISATAPVDGAEGGSANADPGFTSATNLTFAGATPAASSGVPVSGITTDITGAARSGSQPTIGAHETANAQNDQSAPALSGVSITSGSSPSVSLTLTDNSAAASNATVQLWYRLSSSSGAYTGVDADVKPSGAMNGTYTWNTSIASLAAGTYNFYVAVRDGGGAGTRIWANPIWTSSFPTSSGFAAADPPNYGTNPATYANVRQFQKTAVLAGGTYEVGSDQSVYKKLTDVASALNASSLTGDVVFELNSTYDGTTGETLPIVFNQFLTTGGNWTATVRVKSGAGARQTRGKVVGAVIKLNGADRMTLDGREGGTGSTSAWTVANDSSATATAAIWLSSLGTAAGATNNTIRYLTLQTGIDPTASSNEAFGIVSSGTSISISTDGADNDNNTFANNTITKARWGIYVRGALANTNDGNVISGNLIGPSAFGTTQIAKGGIVVQYQQGASITQNEVRFVGVLATQTGSGTDRVGIGLGDYNWTPTATTTQNCSVTRNVIHDIVEEKTFSAAGIIVGGTTAPTNNVIANNMIYGVRADGTSGDQGVGIGIAAGDNDKVVYNSVAITGDQDPGTSTSATYQTCGIRISSTTPTNLTLKNNIVSVDATSNTSTVHHVAMVAPATSYNWGTGGANNNDFYTNPATTQSVLGGIGTTSPYTDVTTIASWRLQFTPHQDSLSVSAQPPFLSATDLHLNTATPTVLESAGTPIAGVTTDYDNDARNATTPDIGADEGAFTALSSIDLGATAFVSPLNGGAVAATVAFTPQASFTNNGTGALTNAPVRYRILDNTSAEVYNQTATIASLGAGSASTVSFPAATLSLAGTYTIIAKAEVVGDATPVNDSIVGSITAFTPLSGTYTVGVGGNYTTLTAAVADANTKGVGGAVVFSLTDATYPSETFPITLNALTGASASNTLTIMPASGVTATISGSSTSSILKLNGADWVVIDGSNNGSTSRDLTVTNSNTSTSSAVIWLASPTVSDGATNNVIKNTIVRGNAANTTLMGIYIGGTTISSTAPVRQSREPGAAPSQPELTGTAALTNNANNTIQNNLVAKATYGIAAIGTSTTTLDTGLQIIGNALGTSAAGDGSQNAGIYIKYQNGALVSQNEVQNVAISGTLAGDYFGIGVSESKSSTIERNQIHGMYYTGTSSGKIYGIMQQSSGFTTSGNPSANKYANNMVGDMTSTSTSGFLAMVGIDNQGGYGDMYYDNSVSLSGTPLSGGASALVIAMANGDGWSGTSSSVVDVRGNILSVTGSASFAVKGYAFYTSLTSLTGSTLDYNDLYSAPTGSMVPEIGRFNAVDYPTFAGWKTGTSQDAHSVNAIAPFLSASNLHLNTSIPTALEAANLPIAGVTTDLDGDTRDASTPDIGADEGNFLALTANDMAATAFISPTNGGTVSSGVAFTPQASFTNTGTIAQTSVTVRYRIVDGSSTEVYNQTATIASIAGGAATTVSFPSATVASAGSYTIYAKAELAGDGVPANDEISGSITAQAPLNGTYTVGVGGSYTTLTAAAAAINSLGADGPVVFSLTDATYPSETFPIVVNAFVGASSTNTLTIRPASGVTATISGSLSSGALLKLNGADYVTIDGSNSGGTDRSLTLTNTSTTAPAVIWLASSGVGLGASNNTIKNCNINAASGTTSTAYGIALAGTSLGLAGADNDDVTIQNNAISSTNIGVYANGSTGVSAGADDNLLVAGNAFTSTSTLGTIYGVEAINALGATVRNNSFSLTTTASGAPTAISLETNVANASVLANTITQVTTTNSGGYGGRGITVGTGLTASNITIANNAIAGVNGSNWNSFGNSSAMGIALGVIGSSSTLTTTAGGINLYHNSVNMDGSIGSGSTTALTAAVYVGSGASALNIQNNIFVNTQTGTSTTQKNYGVYSAAANTAFTTMSYNDYFVSNSFNAASAVLGYLGGDQTTLSAFNTAFTGSSSTQAYNVAPGFTSSTNLHVPAATLSILESGGTAGTGITTDIDGDVRPGPSGSVNGGATANDVGADEFDGTPYSSLDMAATAFVTPANGGSVSEGIAFTPQATFTNIGVAAQTNVPVRFRILDAGSTEVYNQTATIASIGGGGGSSTVSFPSATLGAAGAYTMIAKAELVGDTAPGNDSITGSFSAFAPLNGTYTVGSGGAYTTLTAAVAALNAVGASGPVTFSLTDALYDGTETFPITINAWSGASSTNTLTIKPASGVTATITGSSSSAILKLNGADYVTVDGSNNGSTSRDLTIENINTSITSAVVWLSSPSVSDGATHNTIKNTIVTGNAATTTLMGIYSGGTSISTAAPARPPVSEAAQRTAPRNDGITAALASNSDNTYQNNLLTKAQYGIFLIGGSATLLDANTLVAGNNVGSPAAGFAIAGIELKYQTGATVTQNDVQNVNPGSSSGADFYGIEISECKLSTISRNKVHNITYNGTSTGKAWAIDQKATTFTSSGNQSANLYANNMVYDVSSNNVSGFWAISGLNIDAGYGDKVYYNSVSLTGSLSGATTAWATAFSLGTEWNTTSPTNTDVRNNIFSNTGTSTVATPAYAIFAEATSLTGSTLDYNNEYCVATGSAVSYLGGLNLVNYSTLAAWQTATAQEAASQSVLAPFTSATDLHLVAHSGTTLESAATPVSVTLDYDGQARNATTPDIGADEGDFAANRAPVIAPIANQTVNEGVLLTVTPTAGDPDGDILTFSGSSLPTGATVNASTGVLTWTPDFTQSGVYTNVTITATDPGLLSASRSFQITVNNVNRPPVITTVAAQTMNEGQTLVLDLSATDPDNENLVFSLVSIAPAPPSGIVPTVVDSLPNHATFAWTPTHFDGSVTPYVMTVKVVDPFNAQDGTQFDVTLNNVNGPPVITDRADTTVFEATTSTVVLHALEPDGQTIRWSLISPAPPWASLSATSGANVGVIFKPGFSSADSLGSAGVGADSIKVLAADGVGVGALKDTTVFVIHITNVNRLPSLASISDQTVAEGALLSFTASASDADVTAGHDFLTWSLTGAPAGASINSSNGAFSWTPDYNAAERVPGGVYGGFTVTVQDNFAASDSKSFSVTVTESNRNPSVDPIANQTVAEGVLLAFTATGSDPDSTDSIASWSLSGPASGATINALTGAFSWTPGNTAANTNGGVYNETITATDTRGGTGSQSFTITVTDTNNPPTVDPIADQTVAEGSLLTVTPSGSDPDSDPLTWSGSNLPSGSSVNPTSGVFTWTPNYTQAGVYANVTLTASDGSLSASASFQITVTNTNRAPVVDPIANQTVAENALLTVTPSGSDPDGDAINWSGSNLPSGSSVNPASGEFTWTPSFAQAGTYTGVTLSASDGSLSGSASFDITVTNSNRAPVVDPIADQTVIGDDAHLLTVTPTANDADGDVLSWSGTGVPSGASVNPTTGVFTWTPLHTQGGTYTITLTADDGNGGTGSATFHVTVNVPTGVEMTASKLGLPTTFGIPVLGQNPFRHAAEFVVGMPKDGTIAVSVLDARGRVVANLAPKTATPGYVLFRWDGRGQGGASLPSGVYYLRATDGHAVATRRVVKMD